MDPRGQRAGRGSAGGEAHSGYTLTLDQSVDLSTLGGGNMVETANERPEASPLVFHYFDITANSSTNYDIAINDKIRVVDVIVIKRDATGIAGDSVTVKNSGDAISDTISMNALAVDDIRRATSLVDGNSTVSGTLRVTAVYDGGGGSDVRCEVIVVGMRIA